MGANPGEEESSRIREEYKRTLLAYNMVREKSDWSIKEFLRQQTDIEYRDDMLKKLNTAKRFKETGKL